jgi:hypothetical protein
MSVVLSTPHFSILILIYFSRTYLLYSRSTDSTPAQTPRLEEREVFVSTNPSLVEGWEEQVVPSIYMSLLYTHIGSY